MAQSLGQSFKAALKELNGQEQNGSSSTIYNYGNKKDFEILWNLRKKESEKPPEKGHIIIVWDGQIWNDEPNSNLLLSHLTPIDWALAFSIETLNPEADETLKNPEAEISIHIVDLTGEEHDKEWKEWAMLMRHQLLVEMPWVKLYAPLAPEKDGKPVSIRRGYNPIVAPMSSNSGSPALLEVLRDVSQCPKSTGEISGGEDASEGNQESSWRTIETKDP